MRITGKTTEELHTCTTISQCSAQVGRLRKTRKHIGTAAVWSIDVVSAMGGRSWNITHSCLGQVNVARKAAQNVRRHIAPTITLWMKRDKQLSQGHSSSFSQRIVEQLMVKFFSIKSSR